MTRHAPHRAPEVRVIFADDDDEQALAELGEVLADILEEIEAEERVGSPA